MNAINEAAMAIMISLMTQFGADNHMKIDQKELWCLSQNIYFEVVKEAVMRESWKTRQDKTLDKSKRIYYPKKHQCQFSWWCDGEKDTIWVQYMNGTTIDSNMSAWRDSVHIALDTISNHLYDNTQGATYYYAHNIVYPHWAKEFQLTEVIGNHTFMRPN
jgi:N-acetylmuramoyl-L-alanine amidase